MEKAIVHRGALLMLWITAAIWGFAFVAQRVGMEYIGPFTFNGIRFLLGSASLLPLILILQRRKKSQPKKAPFGLYGGLAAGIVLFAGASLQQAGMVYTGAGKGGFITGFYLILVPLIGIFIGQKVTRILWAGAFTALAGLYLLTVSGPLILEKGDLLILLSAFFWAAHVQLINRLVSDSDPLILSAFQFAVCGILSLITALFCETISVSALTQALWPLLYGGLISVGIAYTLQVVAQQHVHPAFASIILSFETVFAVAGGWLVLGEMLSMRNLAGCLLMLAGMLMVQLKGVR
jgi:drug/metabolite transporter (DMT)-like permease